MMGSRITSGSLGGNYYNGKYVPLGLVTPTLEGYYGGIIQTQYLYLGRRYDPVGESITRSYLCLVLRTRIGRNGW